MKTLKQIICPVDFSENAYSAIEQASFLAQLFKADLDLVHVVPQFFSDESLELEKARTLLREAKKKSVPYSVTCKSSVQFGKVADGILSECEGRDADLLFMATDGFDTSATPSSTLRKVGSQAPCSVLAYRNPNDRKGFRKIMLMVSTESESRAIFDFIEEYFSLMAPQLSLCSLEPSSANLLKTLAPEFEIPRKDVHLFGSISELNKYCSEHKYDLLMLCNESEDTPETYTEVLLQHSTSVMVLKK